MQVKVEGRISCGELSGSCSSPFDEDLVGMKLTFSIIAGAVLALGLGVEAESVEFTSTEEPSLTLVVPKTVVSSTMRFVFEVGLEGTGHHMFGHVLDHLFKANPNLVQISGSRKDAVDDLYGINYSMGLTVQHYNKSLSRARNSMRNVAQRGQTLPFPGTLVYTHDPRGFHSYPTGIGPNKALKYFDLRLLAEVAEEEGVDLRVLYLRRPAKDLVIANTIHRTFQT